MRLDACARALPLDRVEGLRLAYDGASAEAVLEGVLAEFPGEVAMVSSFGAEAAVLLKMVADLDRDLPVLMIDSLLLFEGNVRSASILGIVGAGGVGLILNKYMALFKYQELMGALILLVVAVTILDRISDAIRRRII